MKVLRIAARPEKGFRRCGIHHPPEAVDHPMDRFSEEQIETLKAEPRLVVAEVDVPDEKKPAGGKDKA